MTTILDPWELESTGTANTGNRVFSAGSQRVIIYTCFLRTSGAISQTVTQAFYGNRPMSLIESEVSAAAGADIHVSSWYLLESEADLIENTLFTITRSTGDTAVYRAYSASYEGVDQNTPILDSFSALGLGGSAPTGEPLATQEDASLVGLWGGADQNGGTQDVAWGAGFVEQVESTNTQIYSSVAIQQGDGNSITPSGTPTNNLHTILQAFSLKNADIAPIEADATSLGIGEIGIVLELFSDVTIDEISITPHSDVEEIIPIEEELTVIRNDDSN